MNPNYLDFEQPIADLEDKIQELSTIGNESNLPISDEIEALRTQSNRLTQKIYSDLKPWDIVRVARHPGRPYTLDYIQQIFSEFHELHGDRKFGNDPAIIAGLGRINGRAVAIIGQEKGRSTNEKIKRNFGMARPEGYRKALRVMQLAERFGLPVITLIDTPGAYPGVDSEERGISEAIAHNMAVMSRLRTPIICAVIGEGSSGGAIGIGVGDHLCMLQYATYFVISPEGCAKIIWKSVEKAPLAAEAMGLTSDTLMQLKIVDAIIEEPPGGAHRDKSLIAQRLKSHLLEQLGVLDTIELDELLERRYQRLMSYGAP